MHAIYEPEPTLGHQVFGQASFGDTRRSKRLANLFDILQRNPGGSLPDKFAEPADLRAFYRLCNCSQVTHANLIQALRDSSLTRAYAQKNCRLPKPRTDHP